MKITIVGTGYVGLVTGTCFAETGNEVVCVDIDTEKIAMLTRGEIPIYEPGLAEMVERNAQLKRLQFSTNLAESAKGATLLYLAVGTPSADDGRADLSSLWTVVEQIAPHISADVVVVIKSTVPVGTNAKVASRLRELTGRNVEVASNPEFLKEGAAIDDCMKPDRVVVGCRRREVGELLRELYAPYLRTEKPFLVMQPESAEMTKYAANAMLATKISFINEMANLCELMAADIDDVRRGIGHDARIGFSFLFPGVGYGGSCFPKDVRALESMATALGVDSRMLIAVEEVNHHQKYILKQKIEKHFQGNLTGKTIAIWGLAFKPKTDDVREAPALVLIDQLLAEGVHIQVHDPEATANVRAIYGDKIRYGETPQDTLTGADALAVMTEWKEYVHIDLGSIGKLLNAPVVFDGRNIFSCERMQEAGFTYYGVGRRPILPS